MCFCGLKSPPTPTNSFFLSFCPNQVFLLIRKQLVIFHIIKFNFKNHCQITDTAQEDEEIKARQVLDLK